MDKIDEKILNNLIIEPRITSTKISKICKISQQVSNYRINRLIENEIIISFDSIINYYKLGYSNYYILLKFKKINSEIKKAFIEYLIKFKEIKWINYIAAKKDFIIEIISKNFTELDIFMNNLFEHFKELNDYEIFPILNINIYKKIPYSKKRINSEEITLNENSEKINISETDKKILNLIEFNARENLVSLSQKINMNYHSIKTHIQNLEKNNILLGYQTIINSEKINIKTFKIFLSLERYNTHSERKIFMYTKENQYTIRFTKIIGSIWTYEIEVEIESYEKAHELVLELKEKFSEIDDYEIYYVMKKIKGKK